ncbi:hypothetical protein GCM10009868_30510 [Terrabacter aerolatus]|uniref:DUF3352 domain-containing protein n=1 Tax=Terrabacter aerolatus TaxID=422442 RepID=A0A512D2T6_9MICO|nr:DUF3352 domain-containing protein [Terrabacter aerolatus]GEO30786.1 hypothetical protein TAE01_25960 [Terrabacter aerolatus]
MTEPTQGHTDGSAQHYTYPVPPGASQGVPGEVTLADDPQAGAADGRKRTGLLVAGVVTALALGGAGAFAVQTLSGGGSQPADVLPGDAYAYVRLDIDPSAGQKIAAVRFLSTLPQVKDTLGSDDPRKKLWDMVAQGSPDDCTAKLAYDTDIAPWLGDRIGAAVRPGGTASSPAFAVAIQVKDEAAAKDGLTRLLACNRNDRTDLRMKDGYAIITPSGAGDATLAAADKGSLAQNSTFTDDMKALGEQGVMSAWFDMGTGLKQLQQLSGASALATVPATGSKGRVAAALRFDADYVELAGVVRGTDPTLSVKGDGTEMASLPADTLAAVTVSGADRILDGAWPTLKKQIEGQGAPSGEPDPIGQVEQQLGLKLPDDVKILLGRSFTLAMPGQDFSSDVPVIGAKVVSSDAKRADELVGRLMGAAGAGSNVLTHEVDGDKVFVATTRDYADNLKAGGRLGDSDSFKLAVGDVSSSTATLFVDLDKVDKLAQGQVHGEAKTFLESLRAVGFNSSSTGNGEGTFTLRVVGD